MSNRIAIVFIVFLAVGVDLFSQLLPEENVTIRIPVADQQHLRSLTANYYVVNFNNDSADLVISNDQISVLKSRFTGLKLLPAEFLLDDSDMAENLTEAFTFTKYPTYFQYDTMMHQLASDFPDLCKIDTFGYSRQGRLLLALKISDNAAEDEGEPTFLYTATMHGDELIGYILTLRLADFLLRNYGQNSEVTDLLDNVELWINPLSNPDETYYPDNSNSVVASRRPDISSLDLNRNFPDPFAGDENDTTGLQVEIQNMMLFMMKHHFNMSANIHAGAEVVNYPWDHKYSRHPDDDWFIFISREYADVAHDINPNYMNGFTDGITNGWDWYDIYGGRQDYVNFYLGGREVTLELSNTKKLASEMLETYWDYNQWSLINMISQARYGIHGTVISAGSGLPVSAKIMVENYDSDSSIVYSDADEGKFFRYLKEGFYDLVISADGYFNDTVTNVSVIDYQTTTLQIELDSLGTDVFLSPLYSEPVLIYPNPSRSQLHVEVKDPAMSIDEAMILSIDGKIMLVSGAGENASQISMDVAELQSGLYILQLRTNVGIFNKLVVIE